MLKRILMLVCAFSTVMQVSAMQTPKKAGAKMTKVRTLEDLDREIAAERVYQRVDASIISRKEKELERIKKENNYDKLNFLFIKTSFDNEIVKGILKYINLNNPDLIVIPHKPSGLYDKLALESVNMNSVDKKNFVPILAYNNKSISKII